MNKTLKITLIVLASLIGLTVIVYIVFVSLGMFRYSVNREDVGGTSMPYDHLESTSKDSMSSPDSAGQTENSSLKIIRTGSIIVAVDGIDKTLDEVEVIRNKYKGEILNLEDSGKGKYRTVVLTLRVKESDFEKAYNELKTFSGEYESSAITANDVTDAVMDMQARLKNLKSVENQYLGILKNAKTVTDTLAVQRELNTVRGEIEYLESSLDNLDKQTSYSTIFLSITQSSTGTQLADDTWKPLGILKDAARALVGFAKFLGNALIWVLVFSPVVAVIVVPVVLIQKKRRK